MTAHRSKPATKGQSESATLHALILVASLWCALVVYVIVCVNLGVIYPLGRSVVAGLVYGMLLMDPMFPDRTKLDLPIALTHAFVLFKCLQWLRRQRRQEGRP
jgi:uncharacterized membrane protein